MPSLASPKPNFRTKALDTTLVAVRQRRRRRHQVAFSSTATVVLTSIGVFWWTSGSTRLPSVSAGLQAPSRAAPSQQSSSNRWRHIDTLPQRRAYRFITQSSARPVSLTAIERSTDSTHARLDLLSDDELLAQLPPESPAALVWDPKGQSRLIRIPSL